MHLHQTAAANQKPLFIVYKQNLARRATFKWFCTTMVTRAEKETATATLLKMNLLRANPSVCRSLFGPVDHDQLRRDLDLKFWEITEQDSRRWNFNFQCGTPLPGRFQWEEMRTDGAAAQMQDAVSSPKAAGDSSCEESEGTDEENCSSISNTPKCPGETTPCRRKRSLCKLTSEPGAVARITDYFAKRRTVETNTRNALRSCCSDAAQSKNMKRSMFL